MEPSEYRYYQPAWTLVGGGASLHRPHVALQRRIAQGIKHIIAQAATELLPDSNQVKLANGEVVGLRLLGGRRQAFKVTGVPSKAQKKRWAKRRHQQLPLPTRNILGSW